MLGYAAGLGPWGISPFITAPLAGLVSAAAAFSVYSSESDRRPPILWQAALADGIIAGITSGVTVAVLLVLIADRAGASTGPSGVSVLQGLGGGALVGVVAGALLGPLTLAIGGPARMTRPLPARAPARRKRTPRGAAKRRH